MLQNGGDKASDYREETVYTSCDLTHNSKDESEPDKTVQVEQPGVI